jgi:hypothetical protein
VLFWMNVKQSCVCKTMSCLVTLVGSNIKRSKVKPCAQCIVQHATSWMGYWIPVIVWLGLPPIFISTIFHSIGVQLLFILKNCLYKWEISNLVLFPIIGFSNYIHMNNLEDVFV